MLLRTHEANVDTFHSISQPKGLHQQEIWSRCKEPRAGNGNDVRNFVRFEVGPHKRVSRCGCEHARRCLPVDCIAFTRRRGAKRCGTTCLCGKPVLDLTNHGVPGVNCGLIERRLNQSRGEVSDLRLRHEDISSVLLPQLCLRNCCTNREDPRSHRCI